MASHTVSFRCEQCGRTHEKTVYDGVDVSREPQFRARVMDASIFDFVCPDCGAVTGIIYPFLYHDPENGFMVQLVDSSVTEDPFTGVFDTQDESDRAVREVVEDMKMRYYFRTVTTPNELMEKIAVFEAGYDDRVLELIKQGILAADPAGTILHLYFAPTDSGPVFLAEEEAGFTRSFPLDMEVYESIKAAASFDPSETRINEHWAKRYLAETENCAVPNS